MRKRGVQYNVFQNKLHDYIVCKMVASHTGLPSKVEALEDESGVRDGAALEAIQHRQRVDRTYILDNRLHEHQAYCGRKICTHVNVYLLHLNNTQAGDDQDAGDVVSPLMMDD
ncbi:hypothetical protein Ancab_040651 [Ancistrocladus abbreviatus]